MKRLSTLVRSTRVRLGKNLRDLAADVGVSASFLSRIERGEHLRISNLRIVRLADALGVPADDVYLCAGRVPPDVERYVLANLPRVRRSMSRRGRRDTIAA